MTLTPARLPFLVAALALGATILWAAATTPLWASFREIAANPWGVVTLIDLYCAFLVSSVLIWRFERSRPLAIILIALTPVLGSLVPLLWLAFRLRPLPIAAPAPARAKRWWRLGT